MASKANRNTAIAQNDHSTSNERSKTMYKFDMYLVLPLYEKKKVNKNIWKKRGISSTNLETIALCTKSEQVLNVY